MNTTNYESAKEQMNFVDAAIKEFISNPDVTSVHLKSPSDTAYVAIRTGEANKDITLLTCPYQQAITYVGALSNQPIPPSTKEQDNRLKSTALSLIAGVLENTEITLTKTDPNDILGYSEALNTAEVKRIPIQEPLEGAVWNPHDGARFPKQAFSDSCTHVAVKLRDGTHAVVPSMGVDWLWHEPDSPKYFTDVVEYLFIAPTPKAKPTIKVSSYDPKTRL